MTDEAFEEFLDTAMAELLAKQEKLRTEYGPGSFARWHFDQETEKLGFFDESDRKILEASVIDIGSYASNLDTWKWAWANNSVPPSLREKAAPLKDLGEITGLALFTEEAAMSIKDEANCLGTRRHGCKAPQRYGCLQGSFFYEAAGDLLSNHEVS